MQYCPPPPRAPHPYLATSDPLLPPTPHFSAGIGAPPQPIMHHPPAGPQAHISNHHAAYACGQLPYPAAHQLPLQATPPAQDRLIAELALAKEQIARQQGLLDLHRIVDGGRPSAEARPPQGTEAAAAASALTAIRTAATPSSHIQPPHPGRTYHRRCMPNLLMPGQIRHCRARPTISTYNPATILAYPTSLRLHSGPLSWQPWPSTLHFCRSAVAAAPTGALVRKRGEVRWRRGIPVQFQTSPHAYPECNCSQQLLRLCSLLVLPCAWTQLMGH